MLERLPEAVGHALREQRAGLDKLAFEPVSYTHLTLPTILLV